MILTGPVALLTPKTAHHIERLLHAEAQRARRDGFLLPDEVVKLLADVRSLAEHHRRQVTDATDADVSPPASVDPEKVTMSAMEISEMAGIKRHTVADAIRRGRLPAHKSGRLWKVDTTDALTWLDARGVK